MLLGAPKQNRSLQPWEEDILSARVPFGVNMNDPTQGGTTPPSSGGAADDGRYDRPPPDIGQITTAGYTPDYRALLASDPTLMGNEAELGRLEGQIPIARREAIRRAVVQAGMLPKGYADADIDEATMEAARQNQFSQAAELGRTRSRSSADLLARLAGRGATYTGGLAAGESRVQEGYERGTNQVTQGLLDAISTFTKEAESKKYDIARQRAQLREAAAMRISQDPRYRPVAPTSRPPETAEEWIAATGGEAEWDRWGKEMDAWLAGGAQGTPPRMPGEKNAPGAGGGSGTQASSSGRPVYGGAFPQNPQPGQVFAPPGFEGRWVWNGSAWVGQ